MISKQQRELYLLLGQSNMAGRGDLELEDQTPHPRVLVFTASNDWELALEPVTHDRASGLGTGPALAFGKVMAAACPEAVIGLVPCAVGATPLRRWQPGGDLYANAIQRARLASRQGTLRAVLWHQGESDTGSEADATTYGRRLAHMIVALRQDLGAPHLPFVVGQLGEFLYGRGPEHAPFAHLVNAALAELPRQVPATACVSSHGLGHKGDELHFNASSARELGRRYAAEVGKLLAVGWG